MRASKITEPVRKSICLSVKTDLDAEQVRNEWNEALRFLTEPGILRLSVSREQGELFRPPRCTSSGHAGVLVPIERALDRAQQLGLAEMRSELIPS